MDFVTLQKYLFEIGDKKFATFSQGLSNSDYISIGVKNPVLKKIIKDHVSDEELKTEEFTLGKYLEIDFIYFGLSLSRLKDIDSQLLFVEKNINKAKSWAITDCLTSFLRKYAFDQYWNIFLKLYKSKFTYDRRMAYVLGLKHYRDKKILKILNYVKNNEEYIVMMSQAWLLATIAIIHQEEVFDYLSRTSDVSLKRKTISKICDSYRFDKDAKERFKGLR